MTRSTRRNFTRSDKAAMLSRATDGAGIIRCEKCGGALKRSQVEFDHIIPEALRPEADKKRKLTPADGQVLGRDCCHRGENSKTSDDQRRIAKAKRTEAKHQHIGKQPTMKGRGFSKTPKSARRKAKAAGKLPVPRPRPVYEDIHNG